MLASSEVVALDSIRTIVPRSEDATVHVETWVARERSFGEWVGVLIQYLLYGRSDEVSARSALASLGTEMRNVSLEAEGLRLRAETVYESVGEEISWLLEAPEKPRADLKRPPWLR
jgi:hypothetical protein